MENMSADQEQAPSSSQSQSQYQQLTDMFLAGRRAREPELASCMGSFDAFIFDVIFWSFCLLLVYRLCRVDRCVLEVFRQSNSREPAAYNLDLQHEHLAGKISTSSSTASSSNRVVAVTLVDRVMGLAFLFLNLASCILFVYISMKERSLVDLMEPGRMVVMLQTVALLVGSGNHDDTVSRLSGYLLPASFFPLHLAVSSWFAVEQSPLLLPLPRFFSVPAIDAHSVVKILLLLVVATPAHMLARRNFALYKAMTMRTLLVGVWLGGPYFIWLLAPAALLLEVNIGGLLCASPQLQSFLQFLPARLLAIGSHRTLTIPVLVVASVILSSVYIAVVGVLFFACSFLAIRESIEEVDRGIEIRNQGVLPSLDHGHEATAAAGNRPEGQFGAPPEQEDKKDK
jgi:hypothetical protein